MAKHQQSDDTIMRDETTGSGGWVYRRFRSIGLNQVNALSMVFILSFTVIFSLLLIHDEIQGFNESLKSQHQHYVADETARLEAMVEKIDALMKYAGANHREPSKAVEFISSVFAQSGVVFVLLEDQEGNVLFQSEALEIPGSVRGECSVVREGKTVSALIVRKPLQNGFLLVCGSYMSQFDHLYETRRHELKTKLIRLVLGIVTLAFILFGFMYGISKIVNMMLSRDVNGFLEFFGAAAERYQVMNPDTTFFKEFRMMAGYANAMVDTIAEQKHSLETLNATLEEKVRRKTAALEVKNFALEEEKAFSQELLASQKQFIRYAIHETNTPLSVIMTNIELYTMKEGRNRYLAKIEAAVKNIFSIYDDLGYLVKKDQVEYPKRSIVMGEYVQSRIAFFDEVAQYAGVSFVYRTEGECPIVFNETKLQRIIDNNLTNAIKYTRPNETIRVDVACDGENVRFSVESLSEPIRDTEKIFEAYYRERKKSDGFGLGLNLVKSICDEEGVEIMIASDETKTRFDYRFKQEKR